ncbi:MAG: ABC transporter permease, partial [candidate division WOR-3 bacterium]|nr:ABC transporter permease [candidate division WOR-3 bacterium]
MRQFVKKTKHYLRAIWQENLKEWKIELTYKPDFIRGMIDPLVYALPYLLYGVALVGGKTSAALQKLTGTNDLITFVTLGYIFIGFLNMALWAMGFSLRKEQYWGTLESVFAAPVPRWVFALGMALHSTLHQGLMIFFQLLVINLIFKLTINPSGILPSLIIVGLMLIALYGFGMMIASLTLILKQGWLVSEALSGIMMVITPIAYPLAVLPVFMQKAALFLPTTYGVMTVRHFLIGENIQFSVATSFLRLIILGIIWVTFGIVVFEIIDQRTRRSGTIGPVSYTHLTLPT